MANRPPPDTPSRALHHQQDAITSPLGGTQGHSDLWLSASPGKPSTPGKSLYWPTLNTPPWGPNVQLWPTLLPASPACPGPRLPHPWTEAFWKCSLALWGLLFVKCTVPVAGLFFCTICLDYSVLLAVCILSLPCRHEAPLPPFSWPASSPIAIA